MPYAAASQPSATLDNTIDWSAAASSIASANAAIPSRPRQLPAIWFEGSILVAAAPTALGKIGTPEAAYF